MTHNRSDDIAAILSGYFRRGIVVGEDALFFARSTLSVTGPADLASLLGDDSDYGGGLVDLVFSPDDAIRGEVEPCIPGEGIPQEAQSKITEAVAAGAPDVRILIDPSGIHMIKPLTEQIVRKFVRKLHLEKDLGFIAIPAVPDNRIADIYLRSRVMLRLSSCSITDRRKKFLARLIEELVRREETLEPPVTECLDFMIRLFGEIADDMDVCLLISEKQRACRDLIGKKKLFEEYHRTHSMEYLMSRKVYDPPGDVHQLARDMDIAAVISGVMCGADGV